MVDLLIMNSSVVDKKVAILATDGFEQSELESPLQALKSAGALPKIVSLKAGKIQGTVHGEKGDKFDVDLTLDRANPGISTPWFFQEGFIIRIPCEPTRPPLTSSEVLRKQASQSRQFVMALGC